MKKSLLLLLALFFCVAFQNCSPISFSRLDGSPSETKISSSNLNNGEGYGGKLLGNFIQYRPDFTCEGKPGPVAQIQATEDLIRIIESHELACLGDVRSLVQSEIDTSIYQRDIIGYKEGIFESFAATPQSIPANLVEVWCRDLKDNNGIETITHFNRTTQEAVTKIYYSTEDSSGVRINKLDDFSVSRVIAFNRVTIKDEKDFELIVYRDQPSTEPGQLKGSLKANLNGAIVSRETHCRLSGTLDPSLWPAKQVVDLNITSLKISENQTSIAFAAPISQGGASQLFVSTPQGSNKIQVSPAQSPSTVGVLNFEFSPESKSLVFWGDVFTPEVFQLVKVNLDGTNLVQLNETLSDSTQTQSTEISFSSDGTKVIYKDGSQEMGHPYADIEMFLRSVPISGGTPTLLNTMTTEVDVYVREYAISKLNKTVAYEFGFAHDFSLYLTDIDGRSPKKFYRSDLPPGWASDPNSPIFAPDQGQYFIFKYAKPNSFNEFSYYAVNTSDLTSIKFPSNWEYEQLSPDGKLALMLNPIFPIRANRRAIVFSLASQSQFEISNINRPIFSIDSRFILDSQKNADGNSRLKQISLETQVEVEVCSQAKGDLVTFKENSNDKSILLIMKNPQSILEFFEFTSSGQCNKKNSLPIEFQTIAQIEFAPNQKSIAIKTQRNNPSGIHEELFYVPLDGRPPYQIDSSVHQQVKISQFKYLKDSKSIFFVADSIRKNKANAFIWQTPNP